MDTEWDIEKFVGDNDFVETRMEAIFIQHKCVDAFKYEALIQANLTQSQKTEMMDKSRSVIHYKTFFIHRPKFAADFKTTQICGGL